MPNSANNKKFNSEWQVEVTAFAASVVLGGSEKSCNCDREDRRDIHTTIVTDPKEVGDQNVYGGGIYFERRAVIMHNAWRARLPGGRSGRVE